MFELSILRQGWLPGSDVRADQCSHGALRLVIGGQVIEDGSGDFGISESALGLLRTLDHDFLPTAEDLLILHGCGAILMLGCHLGITWSVRHHPGATRISDVRRHETPSGEPVTTFPGLSLDVARQEYEAVIVRFALTARRLFEESPTKTEFVDSWDREQYRDFWREYDALLLQHGTKPERSLSA